MRSRDTRYETDFRFLASVWTRRLTIGQLPGFPGECYGILVYVSLGLPQQLQAKLEEVRYRLALLFRPRHPLAIQYEQVLKNKLYMNNAIYNTVGIID